MRRPALGSASSHLDVSKKLFVLALALLVGPTALGQDAPPLTRYIPKDGVLFSVEYDGLDAHAEAWKRTAAYKILNNTPTGVMLEEVAAQFLDKMSTGDPAARPARKGSEWVALVKHVARSGFVCAVVNNEQNRARPGTIVVLRNAYKDKTIRSIMARILQDLNAPNTKPKIAERVGHKVIGGVKADGSGFAWWVEETKKEDLIYVVPSAESTDVFLETLDGKRPSIEGNPRRVDLAKVEPGFTSSGRAFLDPVVFQGRQAAVYYGLSDCKKIDFRWGFQDDALMSISRITTSGPRKGFLAVLDSPTFDKGKLPPIPESVSGFTVASFDLKSCFEKFVALSKAFDPRTEVDLNKALDAMRAKTKLRLKEDILAHLGPKIAWYVLPSKAATAPAAGGNALSAMMAGAGMDQIPKFAIVADIDDPIAFGKVLDEAMAAVNREFRNQGKPPADAAASKGARNRPPAGPSLEFRLMPGETKVYVLSVPPEMSGQIPGSLRPTVRVGPKHVALAVSADVARLALESKGTWTAPNDLGVAFGALTTNLKVLNVTDPRETLPGLLAAFPAKVQILYNSAKLAQSKATAPPIAGAAPGVAPAQPSAPGGPPGPTTEVELGPGGGGRRPGNFGGGPGGPGMTPGAPGASPAPAGGSGSMVLQVDASKMPSADAIRALLFPSVMTVESNPEEIRIVTRDAFPSPGDPSSSAIGISLLLPAVQAARNAAREAAAKQQLLQPGGNKPPASGKPGDIR